MLFQNVKTLKKLKLAKALPPYLNVAFQTAYTFGLLILIQDSGDVRAIINLTEEEALKINSEFDKIANLRKKLNITKKDFVIFIPL